MKYTKHRGYPYPASSKETGNGGLHSELLARAVAQDLDTLDAGWAAELQHPTLLLTKSGDQTGIPSGSEWTMTTFVTEKVTGVGLEQDHTMAALPGGTGWYHFVVTLRSKASGAITAGAQHRVQIMPYSTPPTGGLSLVGPIRYSETFQQGTADIYNQIEAMLYVGTGDEVRFSFFHTNVASTGTIVGSGTGGTRIAATFIARG